MIIPLHEQTKTPQYRASVKKAGKRIVRWTKLNAWAKRRRKRK